MGPGTDRAIQIAEQALANGTNPAPGFYDVVSHGTPYRMMRPQGQAWNAKQVANWIRAQPDYTSGQPVRLVACWTGRNSNGLAQMVANELGVPVLGATTRVNAVIPYYLSLWIRWVLYVHMATTGFSSLKGNDP